MNDRVVEKCLHEFSSRFMELVCDYRDETDKSFNDQADEMGIAKSNMSKYMPSAFNIDKEVPKLRVDQLIKIADYYNVSVDYLLGFTDCKRPVNTVDGKLTKAIYEYTGLTEETISELHHYNKPKGIRFHAFIPDIINLLVSKLHTHIFEALTNYFYANEVSLVSDSRIDEVRNSMFEDTSLDRMKLFKDLQDHAVKTLYYTKQHYSKQHSLISSVEPITVDKDFWDALFMKTIEDALRQIKEEIHKLPF